MSGKSLCATLIFLSLSFFSLVIVCCSRSNPAIPCFSSIISFGGSISDTGNLLHALHGNHYSGHPPYGETFFHRPTGRFSDGRVILDFLAEAMGLPLLPPYLAGPGNLGFKQGINFAYGGATVLESSFYKDHGLPPPVKNVSLHDQLHWFLQALPNLCSSVSECQEEMLSKSLVILGPIGGNDFHMPLFQGSTVHEIKTIIIPAMLHSLTSAINALIELGARTIIVPGNNPNGCIPASLDKFPSSRTDYFDSEIGCIIWLNDLSQFFNKHLQIVIQDTRNKYPDLTILYADFYGAIIDLLRSPRDYGFRSDPLVSCCGGGGLYNYNASLVCGEEGAMVCDDPSSSVFWDGVHLTEAAYKIMAIRILETLSSLISVNQSSSSPVNVVLTDE